MGTNNTIYEHANPLQVIIELSNSKVSSSIKNQIRRNKSASDQVPRDK